MVIITGGAHASFLQLLHVRARLHELLELMLSIHNNNSNNKINGALLSPGFERDNGGINQYNLLPHLALGSTTLLSFHTDPVPHQTKQTLNLGNFPFLIHSNLPNSCVSNSTLTHTHADMKCFFNFFGSYTGSSCKLLLTLLHPLLG
jgi:hypothetical protein